MIRHPDDMPTDLRIVGVNSHAVACVDDMGSSCCVCGLSPDTDDSLSEWIADHSDEGDYR